ncbi:sulfite exporter TauE/SafE family protein [Chryseobacterium indologenes]|uniref:sulfite exporter TauE/SafE family protein n=1 Tax=Chryseobacterium TaxID=59732 RepID=UPI000487A6FF|nr:MULTISPECIES: sulfite exporter TauE/SafE family protein [Chryseobacterium]ATN04546.1 sulfite exporter TauE/SafE family protein [Chryseobacterium indologenes]AYY86703.1 sulfite exporter TauE/SafE family protein [Chryseobacterium indologenes]QIX83606.1 sulfite exporter TauE/SafE family protein [Chryseobacterium indologenes]TLX25024.1 sulfite exporter TauE/SafE family protein [Chryseobacterium indologenes]UDQ53311.1 sulfite exporter TauE/SafE family protein [Chryseobacterium indologenes]
MEILGYTASVLIGISLGLIGGGGSILTVPVLVYLFGLDALLATEYSLFIVGASSIVGSFSYCKKGWVDFKIVLIFGIPSVMAIFLTRTYFLPFIPDILIKIHDFAITRNVFLLLLFAGLMILASYKMIRTQATLGISEVDHGENKTLLAMAQGAVVGVLTGLVGAGGGFMIIPALVNLLKVSMKTAIGTSLVLISFNSLIGFLSSVNDAKINWNILSSVTAIAIIGILIGSQLSKKIDGKKLKPAFGWFILIMGIYIITRELFF